MSKREFIQQIPNRITGVILGLVFYYNAEYLGDVVPANWEGFVEQNMQLAGVLLAGLSVLQLSVNWYIATTEEFDEKKL
jgi:hypothetical protein